MKLDNKVALVTGGSTGIGRATAIALAKEGANVAITARRAERCDDTVSEINDLGGDAIALPGNISEPQHVESLVEQTVSRGKT